MIELQNLSKRFMTLQGEHIIFSNLSLRLPVGHSLGLLGRNGAGKSTLMQIIANNIQPSTERIVRSGIISWPISRASSLHFEMTGLQNTRFLARVYGVDTDSLAKYVEDFANISKHFYMPLRTYSSSMRSRISFEIAINIPFDTYLINKITGAGDQSFKAHSKAMFRKRMTTADAIMISHSIKKMHNFCDSKLMLHNGHLEYYENIEDTIVRHEKLLI